MKAWDDLINDPDKHLYRTGTTEYWIEQGVRIERTAMGVVKIQNCLQQGDAFGSITSDQWRLFYSDGWLAGVYTVNINECERRLSIMRDRMLRLGTEENIEKYEVRMEEFREKLRGITNK